MGHPTSSLLSMSGHSYKNVRKVSMSHITHAHLESEAYVQMLDSIHDARYRVYDLRRG